MTKGIIYIATGLNFLKEAITSYESLRSISSLPCVLYTDEQNYNLAITYFNDVRIIENPKYNFIDKIAPLIDPPFDKNLFVDTDTYFIENFDGAFLILGLYDLAAVYALGRIQYSLENCPDYIPEFNTGLFFFKKSLKSKTFFKSWLKLYKYQIDTNMKVPHDQPSFRQALIENKMLIFVLPNEFNFRTTGPNIAGSNYKVKLIHGRHKDYKSIAKVINNNTKLVRTFINDLRYIDSVSFIVFNIHQNNSFFFKFCISFLRNISKTLIRMGFTKTGDFQKRKGN